MGFLENILYNQRIFCFGAIRRHAGTNYMKEKMFSVPWCWSVEAVRVVVVNGSSYGSKPLYFY